MRHRQEQKPTNLTATGVLTLRVLIALLVGVCSTRADPLVFTLTYDGLGVTNNMTIPDSYPGISAATVTHQAVTNDVFFGGVYFWDGVSPGNGYGNLTNVAVGPSGPDVYAGVTITPLYPENYVRLISFDIATKNDGGGDLSVVIYVQDASNVVLRSLFLTVAGDEDNTTHTHVDLSESPVDGPLNRGLAVYWPASDSRLAIDNVCFEIVELVFPVATNLIVSIPEDTSTDLVLLGSIGEGTKTFEILDAPTNGTLIGFNPSTGDVIYTPEDNFHGSDTFRFTVSDGTLSATGVVSVIVMPVDDAPIATSFIVQTTEDTSTDVKLLGSDVDGSIAFAILAGPTNGVLSGFDAEIGDITYEPAVNYNGDDTFTFTVSEGGSMATGVVSVVVVSVNDTPVAANLVVETVEDREMNLVLPGSDAEGPVTFAIAADPIHGVLSNLDPDSGAVSYTPAANYIGYDAFTFTVSDGTLLATGAVSIAVVPAIIGFYGGIEVAGNIALLPDALRNLAAYGLSDGTNSSLQWTHTDAGHALGVAVRGRYAFVAGGLEGLTIIDLNDSDLTVPKGRFRTQGHCVDVEVFESTAFLADMETGVIAVDVTDPSFLPSISVIDGEDILDLEIASNLLFVAGGPMGLQIYEVSDSSNPVFLGGIATSGIATRIRVHSDFAYVVCGGNRLEIFNVQNPQAPTLSSSYTTAGSIVDLDVSGDHAFLANSNGTLDVLSVSDATNPLLLTNYTVVGGATGVRVVGNLAYLRNQAGRLEIVELAGLSPIPPQVLRPVKDVIGVFGQEVVVSVDAKGTPPLTYHWFKDGTPLVTDTRITGTTGPLLKIQGLLGTDEGAYSVTVSNAYGEAVSSNAMLTVVLPGTPVNEGDFDPGGFAAGVWMDEQYAYAAAGDHGLRVFDISNPHFPAFRGNFDTEGNSTAVEVLGDFAFVADGSAGIQIIDLRNPILGAPLGNYDTPGTASGLSVVATTVYVADGETGLRIVDASNRTQPEELGGLDTPGTSHSVRTIGGLAYVADGVAGVQIINVMNPAAPSLVGSFDTAGTAFRVEIVGRRAFVADGTNGLVILDVSDPAAPTLIGHYPTAGPAMALVVVDTMALLAEGPAGLEVVNISDPKNVVRIGVNVALGDARDVKLAGNTVSVACGTNGVRLLSLFGIVPAVPEVLTVTDDQYLLPGQGTVLQVMATGLNPLKYQWFKNGRALFESANINGVISDTLQLTNLMFAESGEYSLAVWNAWNLASVVSVNVHVVPLGTPVPRTFFFNDSDLLDLRVSGQLAYVASRMGGLGIIDFGDLQNPVLVGNHPTLGFAQSLQVRGHLAYVAAWDSGLEIFDASNTTNLVRIGRYNTPGLAVGVQVAENLAYVADQDAGLQIVDVRNPRLPFLVANVPTLGRARNVQVHSGIAYVATSGTGLEIFDVSDPLGVVSLGSIDTPGEAENVEVIGTRAYVSDYDKGLQIIDVSDPFAPALLGEFPARGDAFHVQVVSNLAYVAQGVAGLDAIDTSDPSLPTLALPGKAGAAVHALQISGKHAYLADRVSGFVVAELIGMPPVPPQLVESPENMAGIAGSNVVLSVSVSGTPPFDYQWYKDGMALAADARVHGIGEPHLCLNDLTDLDAGAYFAVVSSPYGVVTSAVANVIVSAAGMTPVAPAFVSQPVSQMSLQGGGVTFQAVASGSLPIAFRWYLNGEPLFDDTHYSGVTSNTLEVSNIALKQAGAYQLKAWNVAGLATSAPASLTFIGPLQDQINNSPPGSTIPLPVGVYEERLIIAKDLTLTGAGPGATILDALGGGTTVIISNDASVTLSGLTIRNGRSPANEKGGAIKNMGQLLLLNCELTNNAAEVGGAIANHQIARIFASSIRDNVATGAAGGVFNDVDAELEITDSTITENTATLGGGLFNAGSFFATNCTVSENRAVGTFDTGLGLGGGIYSTGGTSWIVNCTISGNRAEVPPSSPSGGVAGALFTQQGTLELCSTTLAFNFASSRAGGVMAGLNSLLRARNTIFAGNRARKLNSDYDGILTSAGFNLLQATNAVVTVGETTNDLFGLDPLLGPLQDNRGATHTHALSQGSPAIDAGACGYLTTDQRGWARPFGIHSVTNIAGRCDIGAFESTGGSPIVVAPANFFTEEDAQLVIAFFADDVETPDSLSFSAVSDNEALIRATNIVVDDVPGNRTITIRPETNQFGTATIYVRVTDIDGFTNDVYFDVVVQPVNDAPVATDLVVSAFEDTVTNLFLLGSDVEGPITFAVLDNPAHGALSAFNTNTGTLTYTPALDYHGPDLFRFNVSDGVLQTTGEVSITVSPVNDAPVIAGLTNVVVEAPFPEYVLPFTVTDVDDPPDAITFEMTSLNSDLIDPGSMAVNSIGTNRLLHLPHLPGDIGVTTIRIIASDGVAATTNEFILEVRLIQLSLDELTVQNKEYDGEATASISNYGTLTGVWAEHDVTLDTTMTSATFDSPVVGAGKTVTVTGLALSGTDAAGYSITEQMTTTATIVAKALIVTAGDEARAYGQTNPAFTLTYSGFVNSDNQTVLEELPVAESEATIDSPAGHYTIAVVGGQDRNYELIRVNGTLTITNVPPVILSLTRAGTSNMVISWSAVSNQVYRLLYTDDVRNSNWINQPPDITARGLTAAATNVADTAERRFYRVLLLP